MENGTDAKGPSVRSLRKERIIVLLGPSAG
jgi:hypothetical protein